MPGVVDDVSAVSENDGDEEGAVRAVHGARNRERALHAAANGRGTNLDGLDAGAALCVQTLASCEGTVTPLPLQPASVSPARPTITPMAHIITLRIASAAPPSEHPPPAKASAKMRWRAGVAQW
jgi:hypothetical protein